MRVPFTFLPDEYAQVCLGDDEWGNQLMQQVAEQFFADNPSCMFVQMIEHAGWALGFRRDGSIWSTANDMAVLKPGARPKQLAYLVRREPNQYQQVVQYPLIDRPRLYAVAG